MEIQDQKKVWVVWANTDNTEGRGQNYPLHVCESPETAIRLGRARYVQGCDCPVDEHVAVKIDGRWLVPGDIVQESDEDRKIREHRERKKQAIERARKAGLSDEDIALLA